MSSSTSQPITPNDHAVILARTIIGDDGRRSLTCEAAIALAEELGVPLTELGDFCQKSQIKIRDCQLGCFGRFRQG